MRLISAKMRVSMSMSSIIPSRISAASSSSLKKSAILLAMATLAGCASNPPPAAQRFSSREESGVDPRYGVRPSPRVVADGEDVPQGGGRYQVGKPYKIAGKTYVPSEKPYAVVGLASWYGSDFHGRKTANGEIFDRGSLSAAHPTMPLPSYARVTNLRNAHSIIVRVNDRGPYHGGRVMDVSERVADALDFRSSGTARVKVEWIKRAELSGSDNNKLLASLRTDGEPATIDGIASSVMVAERPTPVRTAYNAPARHDSVDGVGGTARSHSSTSDARSRSGQDDMTALMKNVGEDGDNTGAIPAKTSSRASSAAAPLPPTRPFDLGGARSETGVEEALN